MKTSRWLAKYGLIFIWGVTILFPVYGNVFDRGIELNGVSSAVEEIELSLDSLGDGSYQTYLNDAWESDFPGKKALLKVRNQILYSVFNVSPNANVVIGEQGYLYEPGYILTEIQYYPPETEEYFENLGSDLNKLNEILTENNKELYVFITPSKAHFYKYFPENLVALDNESAYTYTNYEMLLETLKANEINYFDSIEYITENRDSLEAPLFYSTGIHWSQPWGETCAVKFLDYMNSVSNFDLAHVSVNEFRTDTPIYPAADLYSSLNLIQEPKEDWWDCEMVVDTEGTDKPNIFYRGGSFMGQSLGYLIKAGIFSEDVHFENSYYFTDNYSNSYTLSSFTSYDEMDLESLLEDKDILVLEVNEGAISQMSWGFIDYLIEHPDFLQN